MTDDPARDIERLFRERFNEPFLLDLDIARLVGFGEDDRDLYLIADMRDREGVLRRVRHTAVGGYHFLTELKGQNAVVAYNGELWDDFTRIDDRLAFVGVPKVAEIVYENHRAPTEDAE